MFGFSLKTVEEKFIKKVTHVHELITEQSLLDGSEFITEEDMVAAGISESLGSPCWIQTTRYSVRKNTPAFIRGVIEYHEL